jgi:hypothetical protein
MDQFADRMWARGPTLAPDREMWTGRLHIVDLPDATAILWGDLLSDDSLPAGTALAARAASRDQLGVLLGGGDLEIHDWEFGGRR